ncbi:MAG: pyridoxal phosphate-dependent aminotransferase [Candidatus Omnitrophica bacterium]|nr:pyridoxal phosphate-dependent aminotransferase [Candidatus Omnitrophota bacterium]
MKLSNRIVTVSPSLTLQITAKAKELKAQGRDVISFGAGEPDFDTPSHIKEKAIEAINNGFTKYTPASGMPSLKKVIVEKFSRDNALNFQENQIIISCGAKHSLFNIFQVLLNEGDEVIIPAPYWLSYPEMVKLAGGVPVFIETTQPNNFKIDAVALQKALTKKTRVLILNSPSNPTGAVYTKAELQAIADCAVKHSLYVVSDEIYEKLLYDGLKHVSIASLGEKIKDYTITVNGVSKSFAMTGWRIGYIAAPAEIAKAIGTLQSHSTSNPTSFAQVGALEALHAGEAACKKMVTVFSKRRDLIIKELSAIEEIIPFKPSGAFYAFCDISRTGLTAMDFATRILDEANVAVIPGEPFGSPHHIRLSFAISDEAICKGVKRIGEWVHTL